MLKELVRNDGAVVEELTINKLQEEILIQRLCGKKCWEITEDFLRTKKRSLSSISGLKVDVELPYIMLVDKNELILKNELVSMMFLDSSIQNISKHSVGDKATYIIAFKDGTISIK